jgi:hypothetical protein
MPGSQGSGRGSTGASSCGSPDPFEVVLCALQEVPVDRRAPAVARWTFPRQVRRNITLSEAAWELSFGIYLIVKGFRPSPILAELDSRPVARGARA